MEKRFFEDLAGKVADIFIEREVGKKLRLFEENAKLYGNDEAKTCVRCKTLFLMAESGESCPCPNCQTMWCMREC